MAEETLQDRRRRTDGGWLCHLALRTSQLWDFVDRRQADAHLITVFTLWVSYNITTWAMHFAAHGERPGIEVAAIIGAIAGPWALLQGAIVKFVFEARKGSFQ